MLTRINIIGYATSNDSSIKKLLQTKAYKSLQKTKVFFEWHAQIAGMDKAAMTKRLAKYTQKLVCDQLRFIVLASDSSSLLGSWSGAYAAMHTQGSMGLICINTATETTLHSLSCLLGNENPSARCLQPENICLLSTKAITRQQAQQLAKLKVHVYDLAEINQQGLATVLAKAKEKLNKQTVGYGLNLGLAGLSFQQAEPGFSSQDILASLASFAQDKNLLGIELTGYSLDVAAMASYFLCQLLEQLFVFGEQ